MNRFQWKWIFTGSKTCCTIWRPFWIAMAAIFESKMAAKIQKSSELGKIWFPSRSCSCELIIVIVFGIGSHGVGWCPLLLCNGNSSYITPTTVGWCIAILRFFFTIILILPHIFVRSISRRCLDQTLWNLVGISYFMWSCA